ncbi:MAG: hypothetical protein NT091_03390, partial [Candidatus Falkowbacteria bacterium]|nr:hypothetical protein [Candidatus Falkowbacteria bacterium]
PAPIIISEPPILVPAPQSTQNGLTIFDKPKNPKAPEKPGFFENLKSILPDGHKENILNEDVDMIITKPNIKQVFGIINNRSKENGRIKVEDIRYITKTMGPIEELANLNLIDFRRLHQNPQTAIIKIKEKIELLKSPVNQTYLRIGQQSIAHGKSVGEVIKNLQSSNQDYLTEDEFEAVSELNNELKY